MGDRVVVNWPQSLSGSKLPGSAFADEVTQLQAVCWPLVTLACRAAQRQFSATASIDVRKVVRS